MRCSRCARYQECGVPRSAFLGGANWSSMPGAAPKPGVGHPYPGKCDHDRVIFFTMAGERKIAPMTPKNGRHTKNVATNELIHGQLSNIDNSVFLHPFRLRESRNTKIDFFFEKLTFLVDFFWSKKKLVEKNSSNISMKKIFRSTKNFDQFFFDKSFRIFFDEKFSTKHFSDHLFRSQMIQRFRKSHLEQRTTIIKIRTAPTKKKLLFFPSICNLRYLRFANLLCTRVRLRAVH